MGGRTGLVGLWLVEGVTVQGNELAGGYVVANKAAHCYYHDSLFYKRFLDQDIKIKNINYHLLFIDSFYLPYACFIHLDNFISLCLFYSSLLFYCQFIHYPFYCSSIAITFPSSDLFSNLSKIIDR